MSTAEWQITFPTGNVVSIYRGIRILIKLGKKGEPIEIDWFIEGEIVKTIQVTCDLESAKKMGVELVDQRIPYDKEWQQAEKKDSGFDLG